MVSSQFFSVEALSEIYSDLVEHLKYRFWKKEGQSALITALLPDETDGPLPSMECFRDYLSEKDFQRTTDFLEQFFRYLSSAVLDWNESRGKILELYAALCRCKDWGYDIDSFMDFNGLSLYRVVTEYDRLYDMKKSIQQFISSAYAYLNQQGGNVKSEILDAKNYVKEHLMEELTVQQIAGYVHMNESYFSHLFKKETGQNFSDFVLQQRMEKAIWLLKQTNKRIHEISFEVGIENSNYFSVVFKKVTGKSPQEFRRDFKENERN